MEFAKWLKESEEDIFSFTPASDETPTGVTPDDIPPKWEGPLRWADRDFILFGGENPTVKPQACVGSEAKQYLEKFLRKN